MESGFKNRTLTFITNTRVDHEVLEKAQAAIYHELSNKKHTVTCYVTYIKSHN